VDKAARQRFESELAGRTVRGLWWISVVGFPFFPAFAILDFIMYPELGMELLQIRLWASAAGALCIAAQAWASRRGVAARLHRPLVWSVILTVCIALDVIVLRVGGADTPYYAGIIIVQVGLFVALPYRALEVVLTQGFVLVQFLGVLLLFDSNVDVPLFVNAAFFLTGIALIGTGGSAAAYQLRVAEFESREEADRQRKRSDALLLNVLPPPVADELKANGRVVPRAIESATIVFTDFVGFTTRAAHVPPEALVASLDEAFSGFDEIVDRHGLEKLKTIGDAYMFAGGVLGDEDDHVLRCLLAALEMVGAAAQGRLVGPDGEPWGLRVGLNSGPVVAGVIGRRKFAFDLWSDTVNTAARLESSGQPGTVCVPTEVLAPWRHLFVVEDRGVQPVKGRASIAMSTVKRLKPEHSVDADGYVATTGLPSS